MPNLAATLKLEISRIARKEARHETAGLKKAVAGYRSEIATLKRRSLELERQLRRRSRDAAPVGAQDDGSGSAPQGRYSAKSLASQRRRLGLSASQLGQLIGVSPQSIYNWEDGKARPRAKHMPAVLALKSLGRRTAAAHLERLAGKAAA